MTILLDTTVVVDALRGSEAIRERLEATEELLVVSAITVEEITYGVRPREEHETRRLFDELIVLPLGREEAVLSGRWRREYALAGTTLDLTDTLIAACAYLAGAALATANVKHFPMPELRVEHWASG